MTCTKGLPFAASRELVLLLISAPISIVTSPLTRAMTAYDGVSHFLFLRWIFLVNAIPCLFLLISFQIPDNIAHLQFFVWLLVKNK